MKKSIYPLVTRTLVIAAASIGLPLWLAAAVSKTDKSFLKEAYERGLEEVRMAELAKDKASNPEVKKLAEHIVSDHNKANAQIKSLANSKQVELSSETSKAAKEKQHRLESKSGTEFDKAFVEDAIKDHKSTISEFEKAAKDTQDPDVKSFAGNTLPTLREHLSMAEDSQKAVGK